MSLEVGNVSNYMRLTGEGFFKPSDESHYWPLGNVVMHKWNTEVETKVHKKSARFGVRKVDREDVIGLDLKYALTLDEEIKEWLMILIFGTATTDAVQASGSGAGATITGSKKRRYHDIGKRLITNAITVAVSAATKTAGTDYVVDKLSGLLYIPEGSTIVDGSQLDITLMNHDAVTAERVQSLTKAKRTGAFRLFESDQQSTDFRRIHDFSCDLFNQGGTGDRGPEDFAKFDITVRPTSDPIISVPPIATTSYA